MLRYVQLALELANIMTQFSNFNARFLTDELFPALSAGKARFIGLSNAGICELPYHVVARIVIRRGSRDTNTVHLNARFGQRQNSYDPRRALSRTKFLSMI